MGKPTGAQFFEKVMIPYDEGWGYIWGQMGEVWTSEKQASLTVKYNSNPSKYADYKMGVQYGKQWIGKRVIDCSGLVRWAMLKFMISVYHGSNSQWDKNCSHKGNLTKGMKLPVGALIFTGTDSDKGHVGVYDGKQYVYEAQGTKAGVTRTKLTSTKWKYWGLLKDVEYDFIPGEETKPTTTEPIHKISEEKTVAQAYPLITKGSKKTAFVEEMQRMLMKLGYDLPRFGADGDFGNETLKALKAFQKDRGLKVDGKCGPLTWAELMKG